jgi:cysteine desulfurase
MDTLYLDNNATTPLLPGVWDAMRPFFAEFHGNPASSHSAGRRARKALEDARETVADVLGAEPDEVVFTSGATEANNFALFGLLADPSAHVLVSPVEHPSVVEPLEQLRRQGASVECLPVDPEGVVHPEVLASRLRPDTRLIAVMFANHETGTIQPVADLAKLPRNAASFHCDAVQAAGKVPLAFRDLGVETMSVSAHKCHGPKGVGALLVRRGVKLRPLLHGGHQQRGRRPGTEPVALAVGMAAALTLARREAEARRERVVCLRERFLGGLRIALPDVVLNGPAAGGVPHTINVSFPGCRAETLLMALDLAGVCCSTGSACSSGSLLPSPVLRAMGVHGDLLASAMRFSLSPLLTEGEMDEAVRRIVTAVRRLRMQEIE